MNLREIALSLLNEYELDGKYVNLSLTSHRADRLSREERAALTALLYTTVEHKLTYDYYISALAKRSTDKIDVTVLNILRLGMCQIVDMASIPDFAAVNETVKLARGRSERSFVNGVLRAAARAKGEGKLPLPDRKKSAARYISVAYSFPLWLTRHFIELLGERECEALFEKFNSISYTDLTVNLSKIARDELIARFSEAGITAEPSPYSALTVRIAGSVNPTALPGFGDGLFFVQDTASAISALALDTKEGDAVLDVCACPGGKSFSAAILAGVEGSVLSLDIHESKLPLIESGRDRLGLNNITVRAHDATVSDPRLYDSFDRVICDCPCSGLGVLSKKPDMRYRDPEGISELPELQYSILETSCRYVKAGGALVYSTCTLSKDENEGVVSRFLDTHPDFEAADFTAGTLVSCKGMLTLWPHIHSTDGFFIAKLTKKDSTK